jgi:hypothetical protein
MELQLTQAPPDFTNFFEKKAIIIFYKKLIEPAPNLNKSSPSNTRVNISLGTN